MREQALTQYSPEAWFQSTSHFGNLPHSAYIWHRRAEAPTHPHRSPIKGAGAKTSPPTNDPTFSCGCQPDADPLPPQDKGHKKRERKTRYPATSSSFYPKWPCPFSGIPEKKEKKKEYIYRVR
ncbi:hypothetical protein VTH06DRAFT_8044 [Thermothelomyces fergusii]